MDKADEITEDDIKSLRKLHRMVSEAGGLIEVHNELRRMRDSLAQTRESLKAAESSFDFIPWYARED